MKSIVWLASYPKSGNTWLRAFLANYVRNSDVPCPINKIHHLGIGDSKATFYHMVAKKPFDINNPAETLQLRRDVLQAIVSNRADINFVKTHNINGVAFGVQLIPPDLTRSAIYIMRNPLDVVGSYANHYGISLEEAVKSLDHNDTALPGGDEDAHQFLGNWSNHVLGWTKTRKFPILTLRYEDMLKDPVEAFDRVVRHIGLPQDRNRLERAVRFSDFKALSKQESETPFVEKSDNSKRFFRKGKSSQWKADLSDDLVAKILRKHRRVMKKFGYDV